MNDLSTAPGVIAVAKKQYADAKDVMQYLDCKQASVQADKKFTKRTDRFGKILHLSMMQEKSEKVFFRALHDR